MGSKMHTADLLSSDACQDNDRDEGLSNDVEFFIAEIYKELPCTSRKIEELRKAQIEDKVISKLILMCSKGWPKYCNKASELWDYWKERDSLSVGNGLPLKACRIAIPIENRDDNLEKFHDGHLRIAKCRERARRAL